jgi:hypothetical protein
MRWLTPLEAGYGSVPTRRVRARVLLAPLGTRWIARSKPNVEQLVKWSISFWRKYHYPRASTKIHAVTSRINTKLDNK